MWLFDICHDVYSCDMGRRFYVFKREGGDNIAYRNHSPCFEFTPPKFSKRRHSDPYLYTVVEEWQTPNSKGDTGEFDYYTFMTYQDAAIFIAELCIKLNTPLQQRLLQAADIIASEICQEHKKKAAKQLKRQGRKNA